MVYVSFVGCYPTSSIFKSNLSAKISSPIKSSDPTENPEPSSYVPGSMKTPYIGDKLIPPLVGICRNPYNRYINPLQPKVDDHPLWKQWVFRWHISGQETADTMSRSLLIE